MAEENGYDLVEISPTAVPPVCKIMNYGKHRFEQQKKLAEQKKKQKQVSVKEIKFRPVTEEGDRHLCTGKQRFNGLCKQMRRRMP